jgi:antitoxin component YwqK of YwqJK toxin-antitoxin module
MFIKWILNLFFFLVFGFCEAQNNDSVSKNLIPIFRGYQLEIKDTSKAITKKDLGNGLILLENNQNYLPNFYTRIIYNIDSVTYIVKANSFMTLPQFNDAVKNLREGETIEFRDIYYYKAYSPPAYRLNKKLLLKREKGILVNHILPDSSSNKVDSLGKPHLKWITKVTTEKGEIFREEAIYGSGKEFGSKTYIKNKIYKQRVPINDSTIIEKIYFKNGKTQTVINYLHGDTSGFCINYYENGNIKLAGQYALINDRIETLQFSFDPWDPYSTYDSTVMLHRSVKDKTWNYYNETGKLIRKEIYEQGKLIRKEEYN